VSVLGLLLFLIYINDLPLRINSVSEPIIFAEDTSVIIPSKYVDDFCSVNLVLLYMGKLFSANKLALNLDRREIQSNL
jgi:hypothetical protein